MLKPGLRRQIQERAKQEGEPIEAVRQRVLAFVRGKKLVGYHLPQRLVEFGLLKLKSSRTARTSEEADTRSESDEAEPSSANAFGELFDCAKIFNSRTEGKQQPLASLCAQQLNLNYKRSRTPGFAVSPAMLMTVVYGGQDRDGPV